MAECAQVLKESASAAGITIDVRTIPGQDLFNPEAGYLSYGFGATSWTGPSFQETVRLALLCDSFFTETHFCDPSFDEAFREAEGIVDAAERQAAYDALQEIQWERGGYVVWGLQEIWDGYASDLQGGPTDPVHGFGFEGFAQMHFQE
jgi:peptide/nickel transport system substrate-binding protein